MSVFNFAAGRSVGAAYPGSSERKKSRFEPPSQSVAGPPASAPMLALLHELLRELHRQNLSYCYWKSSRRVHAAVSGDSDLDLLIARPDRSKIVKILADCGFKSCSSVAGRDHPALMSFLGYDEPSGRIVHVHLHLRLIVGESLIKSYWLPWEAKLLASAVPHPTLPIRVLDPGSEAVMLLVRAAVELSRLDPVALRRWPAVTKKFRDDHEYLAKRIDGAMVKAAAAGLVGEKLASTLGSAFEDRDILEHRNRTLRQVRSGLADFRIYSGFEMRSRSVPRAFAWLIGGLNERFLQAPRCWRRRAPGGGIVVAVLGVDGSGKTSVTAAIRRWLGAELDVLPIYFGTGDGRPSLLLWPLKLMVPFVTRMLGSKPKGASHGRVSDAAPGRLYGALLTVWAAVLAVEKRSKLLAARRGADRGMVVIGDRYPQDTIASFNDGPLLPRLDHAPQWLRGFEAEAYALAARLPPDLVIKLVATPEVLGIREPNMQPSVIRERVMQLHQLAHPGARVVCIDAEQPLSEVIRAVKREIWDML